jgi:ribA/ribD-fused uncharacterized protein
MGTKPDRIESFAGPYRFLSNFYILDHPVVCSHRLNYSTVESAFQASKCLDYRSRCEMVKLPPAKAKVAGRRLPLREDWEEIKRAVMADLLLQKFINNSDLRMLLLKTGDADLVEGNHWGDTYWGVCNGKGENHLGRLLMAVRKLLR